MWFYQNGTWLDQDQMQIPADDLGLQRGFGLFETLRARWNTLFYPERYAARLVTGADLIGLPLELDQTRLVAIWQEAVSRNRLSESHVKVMLTGGSSTSLLQEQPPRLIVLVHELTHYPQALYQRGASLKTSRLERTMPALKSLSYLPSVVAWRAAQTRGDHEGLFISPTNAVLEATTANIFAVINDRLITPAADILLGTTRELVLDLARQHGIRCEERTLMLEELLAATEVFLTSTVRTIMPVVKIDDQLIGSGQIGALTNQVSKLFSDHEAAYFSQAETR